MDLPRAPCDATQVIYFDAENLKQFLLFIETSNLKAHIEINDLKIKVLEIDEIKKDIRETSVKLEMVDEKYGVIEDTLKYHQKKLLDLEVASQRQQEVYNLLLLEVKYRRKQSKRDNFKNKSNR